MHAWSRMVIPEESGHITIFHWTPWNGKTFISTKRKPWKSFWQPKGGAGYGPSNMLYTVTADQLAQLVQRRITVREVAGSNPGWTKNQGLKITGKIMLAVCSTSASV